ncbi:glycosyltransferase [Aeromicrobium sp. 636]|uniref:Glycoside hydrolase family 99-like domain-containing protein n=1 Tax=Aeromicrobium senzhongii TaxID=2663859 RepID=A0A8I0EXN9_9ACTN|nr:MULTISPECIES: glycoside hydrolase family 99-like domain-containing protein [Aeromicrobium]MBC9227312.1 glycoside hydrolase family 99-like domain-containing protein [Aeromicrobium senzhongii]MCQ3999410.1 glycosyltransferase [Aeromicrobium sp. 636]
MRLEAIRRSQYFDAEWYLATYPDVADLEMDPAEHYLRVGGRMLRDPGPEFSTSAYLALNRDVAKARMNALVHYELYGRSGGRHLAPPQGVQDIRDTTPAVPLYGGDAPTHRPARVVSFYLPQFHPIAENDRWWGEGFTEWTNVRPARPYLPGQHQPHVPGELGYYDLRDPEVQRRQVELAKLYGVEAFCFYFYWFAGHRLLETPLRNYLDDPTLDLPFMVCWANENWSRRWDGRDHDILIAQEHSPEDDLAFIEHVADYLRDPRYERIDGRPVLLVYRPNLLPDPKATSQRWRTWCRENGIGEIYLAYTQSFESTDPGEYGFDAAIEFPPNNSGIRETTHSTPHFPSFEGHVFRWDDLVDRSFAYSGTPYRRFRGVCPSWDNTARRGKTATVIAGSSPERFARWVTHAVRDTRRRSASDQDRFVFVNAWNEWAEGAHLEPDERYGYAWLEALRVGLDCGAAPTQVTEDSVVEVVRDLTVTQLLARVPEWEARGVDVVVRLDADEPEEFDPGAVRLRFLADRDLGIALIGDDIATHDHLESHVRGVAARLGLDASEAATFGSRAPRSFAARLSALRPLASLAFDETHTDPGSAQFIPALDDVLEAAVPLSAIATGCRVSGLVDAEADGRPSIVIVSHDAHPHGAQRLALNLARGYRSLGFAIEVILLGPGVLTERFAETGAVHRIDLQQDAPERIVGLLRTLRERGASVALANTTVSGALAPWLRGAGFTVVSLVHEMSGVLQQMGLDQAAGDLTDNSDVVVFPSAVVQRHFEDFTGRPVPTAVTRPQGLYLTRSPGDPANAGPLDTVHRRHGLPVDARIVLGVGYGDERKGFDLFAEACAEILRADPRAAAVWVGHLAHDDLVGQVHARIAADDLQDRFVFTGLVEDPELYYAAADVFLLTSREDPFPSVVLEAMDAQLPVIAFRDATGAQELVERGVGVLVDQFDAAAMARAVLDLTTDTAAAAAMGALGRQIVQDEFRFSDYLFDLTTLAGMDLPRVSVVVPNYNYGHLLYARLESIAAQTLPVYEVIVLDDASTDDSLAVLEEFARTSSMPVRLVVNETNSGSVFRQWRAGVELAAGDFVWVAEADDLSHPDFLQRVTEAFADPDVVMSYCQSKILDVHGNVVASDYLDYVADLGAARWSEPYCHDGTDEIRSALYLKNTVPNVSTAVFRREAWLETLCKHGDEIVGHRNAGDWVAYLRLLERGRIAFVPESLNLHRRHDQGVTMSSFNLDHLRQIVSVQRDTIRRYGLGEQEQAMAATYAQSLYLQFGLATEEHPTVQTHPDLCDL